jgi:hypothetical protein
MAISILFNGVVYSVPETGDESWGEDLTTYFVAIPQGALQKTGGSFTLTADVNFGATYGLLSKYFSTRTTAPGSTGLVRLAKTDVITWRNNANSGDLSLAINGSDALTFNGSTVRIGLIVNADVSPSAAIDFSKLASLTSGYILVGSAGNVPTAVAMSGDITIVASGATTIGANKVLDTMIRQSAGLSIIGNSSNSTANVADITAGSDNTVLRRSGTAIGFGLLSNSNLSGSAGITNANLASMSSGTVKGNFSGSPATPSDISAVSAATASTVMYRDTNANVQANNVIGNYATTATAAGTTTLTVASARNQFFTGATTQNVVLPDATTLPATGFQFYIVNLSSGIVTIKDAGGNTVQALAASSFAFVTAKSIGSANGSWDVQFASNNAGGGTVTSVAMTVPAILSVAGSPVTTTGTLAVSLANQSANTMFAGPSSGGAAAPTFRAMVVQDMPTQAVQATNTTSKTVTSTTWVDSNLAGSITPSSASSRVKITVLFHGGIGSAGERLELGIKRASTDLFTEAAPLSIMGQLASMYTPISFSYIDSPATTSATTYTIRMCSQGGGTVYELPIGGSDVIILEEIK